MAKIYFDDQAELGDIRARRVAVIGYGSQGHAHALNLRDSGVEVRVGVREGKSALRARSDGLHVCRPDQAADWGDVIVMLAPDTSQPAIYREQIEPYLVDGKALLFAHGFNIRYQTIEPPEHADVLMVAPKAPGHRVRETFVAKEGTPALIAVHHDSSGRAWDLARSYAKAIGATRAGAIETTFREETETDLFGEQAVLCGGMASLVEAAFETLVEAGYQPEVAYFECLHELKLIVDLMYRGGLSYMRYSVSDTAEHGEYTGGPRVIGPGSRAAMKRLLAEIQDGTYAKSWIDENNGGRKTFEATRRRKREHPIELVGAELRAMMAFLDPVRVGPGD
jgi:ketol-acid reductoisomerase